MENKRAIQQIIRTLGRAHPGITAIYLFGSEATGKVGPLSDLDIAVLLDDSKIRPAKRFDFHLEFMAEVAHGFHRSDVDLVLLNEAPFSLGYKIISEGKLLFERDHDKRVSYEAYTAQRHLDFASFLAVSQCYSKKRN